jgi:hypothetical protein
LFLGCGSTVGDAGCAGGGEPVAAGLAYGVTAAVVFVVGGDVTDPGVQAPSLMGATGAPDQASSGPVAAGG